MSGARRTLWAACAALALIALPAAADWPGAVPPERGVEVGVRAGSGDGFDSTDAYLRWGARWLQRRIAEPYLPPGVEVRWELTLGYWDGGAGNLRLVALGPLLTYRTPGERLRITAGLQPTLISEHEVNGEDLGGPVQFTSHLGIGWVLWPRLVLGARIQHTSNGHLYDSNPGVDIFAVELDYAF